MNLHTSLAPFLALLAAACASAPPGVPATGGMVRPAAPLPAWVDEPDSHPAYPPARFLTAVGHARVEDGDRALAMEVATENGRKQIVAQFNSQVEGVTEIYMRELGVNQEYVSTQDYVQEIRNKTQGLLFGSRGAEEHYDRASNVQYVLVTLDRSVQAQSLLKKVDTELARAARATSESTPAGRLRALVEEHALLESVMPSLLSIDVVARGNLPIRAQFDERFEQVKARIRAVVAELRNADLSVRIVAGDRQEGHSKEDLPEPIVFEAAMGGRPLVGFPVAYALEYPDRAEVVNASLQTGPDGRFSCRVAGLELTGDEENEVLGVLNYASLGEETLRAPAAFATYSLPTLPSSTFSIAVEERNLDAVLPESSVRAALAAELNQRRARVVDLENFLSADEARMTATADPAWLRQRLGGKVDFLARGTARSRFSSKAGGLANFCYAGGAVELIDVRTGVQLASYEVPLSSSAIKSAGATEEDAGIRALNAFAADVAERFTAKIEETFGIE